MAAPPAVHQLPGFCIAAPLEDQRTTGGETVGTLMENRTMTKHFQILAFSNNPDNQIFLFVFFFLVYFIGVLWNVLIVAVILINTRLHTPMYFFLCNLASADTLFTTITIPKLMDILLTGQSTISFTKCFIQLYAVLFMAGTQVILLSFMAYDRYIAICYPLHYQLIMNQRKCILLLLCSWISGCGNSIFCTGFASNLSFCHSNKIQHFFCDIKTLSKISCSGISFHTVIYVETFMFGLFPFLLCLTSYIKIINTILHIKSSKCRMKAFSTCTSHLIVLIMFYGTILFTYMGPTSGHSLEQDQVSSVLYAAVIPMLNPLIYSLRNKEEQAGTSRIRFEPCPKDI
ncbi:olfactory receptor 5V1-like [Spea bombifrons]|uniref:olfactory receptor 5V1-like n=1 Tax=Spea bombifrons TaxID=233779 RepID=UPI00234A7C2B|nr:olfactory receptor 5V1-like [Spea bombifrons]